MQGVHIEDMPIYKASFCNSGKSILASGRRKFFYIYDITAAKVERIPYIVSTDEKSLEAFVADPLSSQVAFLGTGGAVTLYSTASRTSASARTTKQ